jgi:aspartate 1-decarboxylase
VRPGDLVIIMTYAQLESQEIEAHRPTVVHVDEANRPVLLGTDPAQPVPGSEQVSGRV